MNIEVRGVHYLITDRDKSYINKKLHRIDYIKDNIIDIIFTIAKEKKGFKVEVTINFKWRKQAHLHVNDFDLFEGIDKLFNKMEVKISREKGKVQEH